MRSDERGPVRRPALSRCIRVPPAEFAESHWGLRPLLSSSGQIGEDFSDLFSAAAVDELIASRALRTPFVRMAREGTVLPSDRFTGSGGFGAEVADQLDSAKVLEQFADGATIVLQGLHRTWEPLAAFARQLAADLGHPCQVNAYITPADSRGFDPHYDVHDVFVIQVHGEKHWTIHEPVHPDPLRDQPWTDHREAVAERAAGAATIDETLRPGDVLYLPRGWIHSATALGGTSVHLTIGVAALTRHEIVEHLLSATASDASLRRSLPLGFDPSDAAALRGIVEQVIADVAATLPSGDGAAGFERLVADRLGRRLRDANRPEPLRPLATIDALSSLSADSRVGWRQGLPVRVSVGGGRVTVALSSKTVSLPAEAAAAVDALSTGTPSRVGDLPGLDAESALVVARRLVREGVLVVRT